MLKSMTGFGRGEFFDGAHRISVEIKTVNHRYHDIGIRMPKSLGSLEDKIRRLLSVSLLRGRIDVFIIVDEFGQNRRTVRVDKELAMAYHNSLRELAELFSVEPPNDIIQLAKYPDVIRIEDASQDVDALWPKLAQAMDAAVKNLMAMRLTEGENIYHDLTDRIDKLAACIEAIGKRAPEIAAQYHEKLLGRMKELLAAAGTQPDETRVLQEAALMADKNNFTEELVRLNSHLAQLRSALDADEAVGRKLDFIVQEINREANTIASKANDSTAANLIVEIKSEIEKVREQIQNIE